MYLQGHKPIWKHENEVCSFVTPLGLISARFCERRSSQTHAARLPQARCSTRSCMLESLVGESMAAVFTARVVEDGVEGRYIMVQDSLFCSSSRNGIPYTSVHVEVALEDALLERIRLLGARPRDLSRRYRHIRDRLCSIVAGGRGGNGRSAAHRGTARRRGSIRDRRPRTGGDALSA